MQIETDIPAQRIADTMVSAMECNDMTRSWVAAVRLRSPTEDEAHKRYGTHNWYAVPELWAGEFEIDLWEISDESKYETAFDPEEDPDIDLAELMELGLTKHTITRKDLTEGLQLMASKEPRHFGDMVSEDGDAITADILLQLVALKEVVYG